QKRKKRSMIYMLPIDQFRELVKNSHTFVEILREFGIKSKGGNNKTIKARCKENGIDISHIKATNLGRKFDKAGLSLEEALKLIFIQNSEKDGKSAKRYIIKYNLIQYKCCCGNTG